MAMKSIRGGSGVEVEVKWWHGGVEAGWSRGGEVEAEWSGGEEWSGVEWRWDGVETGVKWRRVLEWSRWWTGDGDGVEVGMEWRRRRAFDLVENLDSVHRLEIVHPDGEKGPFTTRDIGNIGNNACITTHTSTHCICTR